MTAVGILQLACLPARAQQPKRLTLREALELASQRNLDLAAANLRRTVALAGIRIARQIPNPSVAFGALRDTPHESLTIDQPLEIGGQRRRRIGLARQEATLTDVEITALSRQVRQQVREAFYAVALARGISEQRARAALLARRLRDIAQARFDAGDVPQLELIQADLELARAEADLTVARQRERITFSQLNALLNEPADTLWDVATPLEELSAAPGLPELTQRALESNSALRHIAQEQKVEQGRRALLEAERIPNVDVQVGADFNSPGDFRVGPKGQIALTLPLFTRNQGELAQSSANLRLLDSEAVAARRAVAGRVEKAYFELQALEAQVDLYRKSLLPAARRLQQLAEESYQAGRANLLTVLDAQRNVQQVEREYLASLFELQAAFAGLEATVGAALD